MVYNVIADKNALKMYFMRIFKGGSKNSTQFFKIYNIEKMLLNSEKI